MRVITALLALLLSATTLADTAHEIPASEVALDNVAVAVHAIRRGRGWGWGTLAVTDKAVYFIQDRDQRTEVIAFADVHNISALVPSEIINQVALVVVTATDVIVYGVPTDAAGRIIEAIEK